jgi:hypothetical protein
MCTANLKSLRVTSQVLPEPSAPFHATVLSASAPASVLQAALVPDRARLSLGASQPIHGSTRSYAAAAAPVRRTGAPLTGRRVLVTGSAAPSIPIRHPGMLQIVATHVEPPPDAARHSRRPAPLHPSEPMDTYSQFRGGQSMFLDALEPTRSSNRHAKVATTRSMDLSTKVSAGKPRFSVNLNQWVADNAVDMSVVSASRIPPANPGSA